MGSLINGVGSYIPEKIVKNSDFLTRQFYSDFNTKIEEETASIIRKFEKITGIAERRYVNENQNNDEIALSAAQKAIAASSINKEELDYLIVAHNFGNVSFGSNKTDLLPSIATRVKHALEIENNNCIAYDLIFGCPGWVEALIHAHLFIKSGAAKHCLVIGAETLSRVVDNDDRDAMIFSDGAGACVLSASDDHSKGILAHATQSFTKDESHYLYNDKSFSGSGEADSRYIRMQGRKIYEFALNHVPNAMKIALEKSGVPLKNIKKVLLHQANEKMDQAIIDRFYALYEQDAPEGIMPMSINTLGNSSVATVPTLLDLILNRKLEGHQIENGDAVIFASVGAGMNINAVVYRF